MVTLFIVIDAAAIIVEVVVIMRGHDAKVNNPQRQGTPLYSPAYRAITADWCDNNHAHLIAPRDNQDKIIALTHLHVVIM